VQSLNFTIAFFLACALHALLAVLLLIAPPLIPEREDKSIPVLLVSSDRANIKQQTTQQPKSVKQQEERVTTQGQSRFTEAHQLSQEPSQQSQIQATSTPTMPTLSSPLRTQSNRSNNSSSGLRNLFSQERAQASSQITQLSNSDLPPLGDYELSLLQRLAANELYQDYPKVLANNKRERIDFSVEIILFANGAIKTAKIIESSNIDAVDQLAIQTAYNASPFDRPPEEDIEKGFRYLIPISYQNKTQ